MSYEWQKTGVSERFIHELLQYCSSNSLIEKVVLFGSRARGDHQQTSDIDLAIYTRNATHSQQNLIEFDMKEMSTALKMDIVFTNRLTKEKLISNILKDGMIIYEQGETPRKTS